MSFFKRGPTEPKASDPTGAPGDPPADETPPSDGGASEIPGERGIPPISRARSVQSRVSTVLTVTLMGLLAAGLLVWYYSGAIGRSDRAQQLAQAAAKRRAQGDTTLPPLGVIQPPKSPWSDDHALPPPPPIPVNAPEIPIANANPYPPSGPPKKTPEELELERRLGGPVLAAASDDRQRQNTPAAGEATTDAYGAPSSLPSGAAANSESSEGSGEGGEPTLASLLKPTSTPAVRARVLATRRLMLPKGAFIDCTLETAISSALPGMTTCVTATDTFGADGDIVLLERGTKLVGETRGRVEQGKPRLFVLWNEARTPTGVVVPLASPGTDSLGRSGLTGDIDWHWWQRFGTAILITVIDGAVQGLGQRSGNGNSTIVLNPSTTSDVATEALRGTLNIRPTIEIPQGDRIQILVARDVDFRKSVYSVHDVLHD